MAENQEAEKKEVEEYRIRSEEHENAYPIPLPNAGPQIHTVELEEVDGDTIRIAEATGWSREEAIDKAREKLRTDD